MSADEEIHVAEQPVEKPAEAPVASPPAMVPSAVESSAISSPVVESPIVEPPVLDSPAISSPVIAPAVIEPAVITPAIVANASAAPMERKHLAEIIVVTSGKGGVGKTTTSASLACGLARMGKRVVVIDFDVGLRNLDLIMGCERRVVYDFVNVIHGECNLRQALIKDKRFDNLFVLAASQTRDKDALTKDGVQRVLDGLADDGFEYIVCDSPAGIEKGAFLAMYFADQAVVVVNPEVSSVRDSDRILGLLSSKTRRAEQGERVKEHLLLTRYSPKRVESGDMLSIKDVQEILGLDVIGVIPEAPEVLQSSNSGEPVILDMNSDAGQAYDDAVARLLGEKRPLRFVAVEKKGFFSKIFGS
jgi:septum site-determining protein MinD